MPAEFDDYAASYQKLLSDPKLLNPLLANMQLNLPEEVLHDRLQLAGQLDRLSRRLDNRGEMESLDKFSAQALELVLGGARAAS